MRLSRFILFTTIVTLLFTALFTTSCNPRPKHVLNEDKMVEILQDLYLANAIANNRRKDFPLQENKEALMKGVLDKHNITQAELDSSLVWYADNIDVYNKIQDTVTVRLQQRKILIDEKVKHLASYKLSDLSTVLPNFFTLDSHNPTFRFRIDSNAMREFEKEKFKFSFTAKGIDTSHHRVEAKLFFRYKDTTIIEKERIIADTTYHFFKPNRQDSLLREIAGFVHLSRSSDKMPKIILNNISNLSVDSMVQKTDSLDNGSEMLK